MRHDWSYCNGDMAEVPGQFDPTQGGLLTAGRPRARVRPDVARRAGRAVGVEVDSTESRLLDAVVLCAARWGIDKTIVDDVAREAGVSRATVYRLFPDGRTSMVSLATDREVAAMLIGLLERVEACDTLDDAVTELLHSGTTMVADHPAIAYMRTHEPSRLRAFFSFERLDALFGIAADVCAPALGRFLHRQHARECVIWAARLVMSYLLSPDPRRDLGDVDFARHLARDHIVAGLVSTTAVAGPGHADAPRGVTSPHTTERPLPTTQEKQR